MNSGKFLILDILNPKHFQNSIVYYLFLDFLVFLTFFSILPIYFSKKIVNFCGVLFYGLEILWKSFGKFQNSFFLRNRNIWNRIFLKISIVYYSFFYFFDMFFLFHLSILVKKFWKFSRFLLYWLEILWKSFEKFQNSFF